MKFSSAIRQSARRQLERLEKADVLVGIPSFHNMYTIHHVVETVEKGLEIHYPDLRCLVLVSDGGSTDDTREEALELEKTPWVERIVSIYRGVPGKGSAVRQIFEAAIILQARAVALFDSDLRSITPDWVKAVLDPVLKDGVDFVAPYYKRYKYDGTITNNIVYNLTRALYGYRIRQPIGGDFGFSLPFIKHLVYQDVWETDVARFGIDIWLSTNAMVHRVNMAQTNLGVKIHDVKDPSEALGPMFRQVVSTLFSLMEQHESVWKQVKGSVPVPVVGPEWRTEPQPFNIDVASLVNNFKIGYRDFGSLWQQIIAPENFRVIEELLDREESQFEFPIETWAKILYDLAVAFHFWKRNRQTLVNLMTPLYFARIASFVNRTRHMSNEEAEQVVEEQARIFETLKPYLIERWDKQPAGLNESE